MRLALMLLLVSVVAACGSSAAKPPTSPAPSTIDGGPPPAWLETKAGSRWLGFSTYCWRQPGAGVVTCNDRAAPKCGQREVPKLSVDEGETVHAHLAYPPSKAAVGDMRVKVVGRTVSWRVARSGPFVLFTKAAFNNDVSYVGCVVLP